jgi:hypothetical protein
MREALRPKNYSMIESKDLYNLVKWAFMHNRISTGKAEELLGIPYMDMLSLTDIWIKEAEKEQEEYYIDPVNLICD